MTDSPDSPDVHPVAVASDRLLATVGHLDHADLRAPSLLPGWSRGHVVAHLALNAEGLTRAFSALFTGQTVPIYDSDERRDADIDALATAPPDELRERLATACRRFEQATIRLGLLPRGTTVVRTPGATGWPARSVLFRRHREVEIHHVDLDAGYRRTAWPEEFCRKLVAGQLDRLAGTPLRLRATDVPATWAAGDGSGPEVSGTAADLGWWLSGRPGAALTCSDGTLPEITAG